MAGLKNLKRFKTVVLGRTSWILLDQDGIPVEAFSHFCRKNWDYAYTTQKRYAEAVSAFIDYLIEAKALGEISSPTKRYLNDVIDSYSTLLRDGSKCLGEKTSTSLDHYPENKWLVDVCQSLVRSPLGINSFSNTLAAINRFLRLSESLATEAYERAKILGLEHEDSFSSFISAISGAEMLSLTEQRNMRMNSVLGSVMRWRGKGLSRPRRLVDPSKPEQSDLRNLDFPIDYVLALASAATSWRDRALWLLLAASGIRVSEALNLQWIDIDILNQKIYVLDPDGRRFGNDLNAFEKLRFKGREVSMTYLIQPFKQAFFQALEQYVKNEYIPPLNKAEGDYVFQYIESNSRGKPYVGVSSSLLNKSFKSACKRAFVPQPTVGKKYWTIHSLRHLYGVYMINDYPVNPAQGIFGLELAEVQILMGHRDIKSTQKYARKKRRSIERRLIQVDQYLMGLDDNQLLAIPRNPAGKSCD